MSGIEAASAGSQGAVSRQLTSAFCTQKAVLDLTGGATTDLDPYRSMSALLLVLNADSSGGQDAEAQTPREQPLKPLEHCSTMLAMMTQYHLDSDLCQHIITFINTALDAQDGPHKGVPECLALRRRLVAALLDKGVMRVVGDLQEVVQESLFQAGFAFGCWSAFVCFVICC